MTATGTELLTELADKHAELLAENERLQRRVLELEAQLFVVCGSMTKRAPPEDDQPAVIHHDVSPNAPR
jgi:hypothetical protein